MDMTMNEEAKPSKIAGIFANEDLASNARTTLIHDGHFARDAVEVISPTETPAKAGHKIEPETRAIWRFLKKSHYILGTVGFIVGLILASVLSVSGPAFIQSSPLLTHMAFGIMGIFFGVMLAGLVSLRPDHDPLINKTMEANQHHQWSVVVQASNREEIHKAHDLMEATAISVSETF